MKSIALFIVLALGLTSTQAFAGGAMLNGPQGTVSILTPIAVYQFTVSFDGHSFTRPIDGKVYVWYPAFEKYCAYHNSELVCFEFSNNSSGLTWGRVNSTTGAFDPNSTPSGLMYSQP